MKKTTRPLLTLVFAAALLGVATPFVIGQPGPEDDRPARHAERDHDHDRDRDRGDANDLREPRDEQHPGDFMPPEPPPGDDRPGRHHPMTDQDVDAARQIIAQLYPELAERMDALYNEDPEKLRRTIEKRFSRVRFLVKLQERDPAMFELRIDDIRLGQATYVLAKQIKQAHLDDDKDAYKTLYAELEKKLEAHFNVKQKVRQAELVFLRRRVEQLEEDLDDRDDDRDDLIEQRLNELVGAEW